MIVIVNSPAFLGAGEVATALAARFEAGAALDLHALLARPLEGEGTLEQRLWDVVHKRIAGMQEEGRTPVVLAYAFHEPEPLARLRRRLADLDDEFHVFCPAYDGDALARKHDDGDLEQLSDLLDLHQQWVAAVVQGTQLGDMGQLVPVDGCEAEEAAEAIWQALDRSR